MCEDETSRTDFFFFMPHGMIVAMQRYLTRVGIYLVGMSLVLALISPVIVIPIDWYAPLQTVRFIILCAAVAAAGAGVLLCSIRDHDWISVVRHPAIICTGALVVYLIARSFISPDARMWFGSWTRFDGLWMFITSFSLLCAWISFAKKYEHAVAYGALIFCVVIIGTTFASRLLLNYGWFIRFNDNRWAGFTGNVDYLAGTLLLLPWAISLTNSLWKRAVGRYMTVVMGVAACFVLYQTGSKAAFVAALVGASVFALHARIAPWKKFTFCAVAVLVLVGGYVFVPQRHFGVRVAVTRAAISEIFRAPLFGYGWGQHVQRIALHSRDYAQYVFREQVVDTSHSGLLDVALGGGVVALVLVGAAMWFVWRDASALERATLAAGGAWFVLAFINPWTLVGYGALVAVILARRSARVHRQWTAPIVRVVWIVVIVVSVGAAWFVVRDARAVAHGDIEYRWSPVRADRAVQTSIVLQRNPQLLREHLKLVDQMNLNGYDWHTISSAARVVSYQKALVYNDRALARTPSRPDTIILRADILRELHRDAEALALMKSFVSEQPTLPQAHFYYAVLLSIYYGQRDGAAAEMRRAFELLPALQWSKNERELGEEIIGAAATDLLPQKK